MTMDRDIRFSKTYQDVGQFLAQTMRVGSGRPYDLTELALAPGGRQLACTGAFMDRMDGLPGQRICLIDLESGELRQLTPPDQRARLARWSPSGQQVAYISDAGRSYDFQLTVTDLSTGSTTRAPVTGCWVESFHWSADGTRILLVAAGSGADLAGAQGAISAPAGTADLPAWLPHVHGGSSESQWRTTWVYELASGKCACVTPAGINSWEACWFGDTAFACIASDSPDEDAWYTADVRAVEIGSGAVKILYTSQDQLGCLSAPPAGHSLAFVEAACSDRLLVAGRLLVGGLDGFSQIETRGVDVTFTAWQGSADILFAGLRSFESVLGRVQLADRRVDELWSSSSLTFGSALYPDAAPGTEPGTAAFVAEGHLHAPMPLLLGAQGARQTVLPPYALSIEEAPIDAALERFTWTAPDGLEIDGWLILPKQHGPHPLVMLIHGGPVWRSSPRYLGRGSFASLLVRAGYAIFQPNPRGSSGRGQEYARSVFGDVGGADAADLISGVDALVKRGFADPDRIGMVGGSYGGFMAAWLVTQTTRFAAAVAVAPVSDWTSLRLTSHIPRSVEMLLGRSETRAQNLYHARSPIHHADRVTTPTLIMCGELDRSTPPSQGLEFHTALSRAQAQSVLVTYPGEGHGVRQFPAAIDFTSRILDWFSQHMPAANFGAHQLNEQ
jgi:dipeptidyl aminopeptidase/acylaminoacyl peptidase